MPIDAHTHAWGPPSHEHPYVNDVIVDEAVVVGYPICDWTDNWYTLAAASEFDRERVTWGSDYPNVSDEATYAEAVHWLDHVDVLSDRDLEWIRGRSFRSHAGI